MVQLSPYQIKERLRLDYLICQKMFGSLFSGKAYRTTQDLELQRNPILSAEEGHLAKKYRIDFHVRTLIGPGEFTDLITIGIDLDVQNYPFEEPISWLISKPIPFSPHFRKGAPICIGEIWQFSEGEMLLGQLLVYIAKLLNWEPETRQEGYIGWNEEAAAYHQKIYKGSPLTKGLVYPLLPSKISGIDAYPLHIMDPKSLQFNVTHFFIPKEKRYE